MSADAAAEHEKRWVALSSLWAAVALTTFKIIVGLLTGSVGILAEAAHSALDMVAAAMTFVAVRISGKPADREHLYGHGKVENLSAMFETVLLLVTCVWIIYESLKRLLHPEKIHIQVTYWSFAVMITSIVIDYTRSRALKKAAIKHKSQALEADALHFETDIWSSLTVIVGLVCVKAADIKWADAAAALAVAGIVIYVSIRLGMRTIHGLLDTAPAGMERKVVEAVEAMEGVADCHNVRIRDSGPQLFMDIHVHLDGNQTLNEAHELTERIEQTIQAIAPGADVTVHPEPLPEPNKSKVSNSE